jgi:hypothetical protein
MDSSKANIINCVALILMPIWAYVTYESNSENNQSVTALIPMFIGVILLFCNKGIKKQNKVIAHIAVTLTLLALIGLFKPLSSAITESRGLSIFRIAIMLSTCIISMVAFINSFIQARKNK